jgi:hypothetical protein
VVLVRALTALALLVVGAGGGVAAALLHESWWGLLLGLAAAALTTSALRRGGMRFAFMLGWFGAIVYAVLPRPEGDYLIPATAAGYGVLGGSFLLFLVALATVPRPGGSDAAVRLARRPGGGDDPVVSTP